MLNSSTDQPSDAGSWSGRGSNADDVMNPDDILGDDPDEDDIDDEPFGNNRPVIEAMIGALRDLDAAGLFGTGQQRERVTLFVPITDSDDARRAEDESAR